MAEPVAVGVAPASPRPPIRAAPRPCRRSPRSRRGGLGRPEGVQPRVRQPIVSSLVASSQPASQRSPRSAPGNRRWMNVLVGPLQVREQAVVAAVDEHPRVVRALGGQAERAQVRERDALAQVRRIDARHVELDLAQPVESPVAVDLVERDHELQLGRIVGDGLPPGRPALEADQRVRDHLVAVSELRERVVRVVVLPRGDVLLHGVEVVHQRVPFGGRDLQLVRREQIVGEHVRARTRHERSAGCRRSSTGRPRRPMRPMRPRRPPRRAPRARRSADGRRRRPCRTSARGCPRFRRSARGSSMVHEMARTGSNEPAAPSSPTADTRLPASRHPMRLQRPYQRETVEGR